MAEDVRGYLEAKLLPLKPAPGYEYHTSCIFCQEQSNKGRLYINTDPEADIPGLFWCHLCGAKGNLVTLQKHFGDYIPTKRSEDDYNRLQVYATAAEYYHDKLLSNEQAVDFLIKERGLEPETIAAHQLGWADGGLRKHLKEQGFSMEAMRATGLVSQAGSDFFQEQITIPYHVAGNVVCIRGKQIGGKYLTPPGQRVRLFNSDVTWTAERLFITEGEFDALILNQNGFPAVGVPGANTWQEAWTAYFADAKRVYLVYDQDPVGVAGAEKVSRLLGPKARILKMPEALPGEKKNDPSEWFVNKGKRPEDFDFLINQARGGLLLSVDDCYAEWKETQGLEGITLGFERMDAYLSPGILPAQVLIVLARTGVGKTIFLLNCFERILAQQPDKRILFISLEQTRGEWFERARRIHRFYNPDDDEKETLDFYRDRLFVVDKNQLSHNELNSCIEQYEYEMGGKPDLVAVDYLGYWARGFKGEAYERTSAAVMALKAVAKDHRIAILAPHQVSRVSKDGAEPGVDGGRDSGVVEETADFVMTLWTPDSAKDSSEKRGAINMKIAKSRHGHKGKSVDLQWAPLSLAMVPIEDSQFINKAKAEFSWYMGGVGTYEDALRRHQTGDTRIVA